MMDEITKNVFNEEEYPYSAETEKIIGICMKIHNTLGCGFLESIYQEVLEIEFKINNVDFDKEKELFINYNGYQLKKTFKSDFVCFNKIIIELKAVDNLSKEHYSQVLNYLKAANFKIGLLINFGSSSLQFKRVINKHYKPK